jgi:hypothetical protein
LTVRTQLVVWTLVWPRSSLTVSTGFASSRYGSPARCRPSFIAHPDYPGERLIACRNPALAAERAAQEGVSTPIGVIF